jgi:catechol 1,2-dioxygenase
MQRRNFIKNTSLCAVAVSTTGFISFDGIRYVGDCETTTDVLGPFYRADSPIRNNLIVKGEEGELVELSGIIKHKDCATPYKNAKIELWHCNSKGVYDNTSNEYLYRGTTYSDDKGRYSFKTVLPVPYDLGNSTRPAHFI